MDEWVHGLVDQQMDFSHLIQYAFIRYDYKRFQLRSCAERDPSLNNRHPSTEEAGMQHFTM